MFLGVKMTQADSVAELVTKAFLYKDSSTDI